MKFNNLDALFAHIQSDINSTLRDEVAQAVKEEMTDAIIQDVYNAYSPNHYERRKEKGGLIDYHNMEVTAKDNTISVRDVAPLDNGRTDYALDEIIVEGYGKQPFPRDFYSSTADKLKNNQDHTRAMKRGLKNRGYKVK